MNEKNVWKYVFEQQNRLSCITRFNNTPKIVGESVAEHSYWVTFLSMLMADFVEENSQLVIKRDEMYKMAIIHDMEEIVSGDIIKILKRGDFKEELEKINCRSMYYLTSTLGKRGEEYLKIWETLKAKETVESKIIDLADSLSVIVYSVREIHMGNKYFEEILEFTTKKIMGYDDPDLGNILKPFIKELTDYSTRFLTKDKDILDDINRAVRVIDKI